VLLLKEGKETKRKEITSVPSQRLWRAHQHALTYGFVLLNVIMAIVPQIGLYFDAYCCRSCFCSDEDNRPNYAG
jgi:hypothetical protein